jgi:hypothetical protein
MIRSQATARRVVRTLSTRSIDWYVSEQEMFMMEEEEGENRPRRTGGTVLDLFSTRQNQCTVLSVIRVTCEIIWSHNFCFLFVIAGALLSSRETMMLRPA